MEKTDSKQYKVVEEDYVKKRRIKVKILVMLKYT